MLKLNFGCGTDIRKDFINLDIVKLDGVDVMWNINEVPYPFESNSFDYILCNDIIEHIDFIKTMKELYRILNEQGKIAIRVPHFTSRNNFSDPTHINRFSILTFDSFIKSNLRNYYFDYSFSKIEKKIITFGGIFKPLEFIWNISPWTQKIYETYFCYWFPALNIEIELVK